MKEALGALLCVALGAISIPAGAVQVGSPAPTVAMPRFEGKGNVTLAGLRGGVVYVDFWAAWCIPCRTSMPWLDRLYKKHSAAGFHVVGVNKDASASDAERFLQRVPVTFTLVKDDSDEAAKAFDVKSMPSGYLVDRKGVVRQVHRGFTGSTQNALEQEVEKLLAEKP
jgi:peroxiredoxin